MDCSKAIDQLIERLLTWKPPQPAVPDQVVAHIAGCRACIEELDALSSALTGEPSTLKVETDKLLTLRQAQGTACQECLDALGMYVEDQVAGEDVAKHYPKVAHHLQSCAGCREQYNMLYELMQQEAAGAFGEPPSYMDFGEWFRRQRTAADLWEQPIQNLHRLMTDILILIGKTAASFGRLPSPLAPQLVPVGVYRKRAPIPTTEEREAFVELLELPHAEANLVIKFSMGPVVEGKGTLVLEVGTIRPPQPIAEAKVTLRDEDGMLLESTPTDEDGLALFRELDVGKYIIQVEYAGQTWMLPVTLAPAETKLGKSSCHRLPC